MNSKTTQASKTALISWGIISLLITISIVLMGQKNLEQFIVTGPYTHLGVTFSAVTLSWLIFGVYAYLFDTKKINASNILMHIGFLIVAFTFLNAMRERSEYGDFSYYIEAANALIKDKHLPATYFYPPLWATLLKYILPYGEKFALTAVWTLNMLSLFLLYFLLHSTLMKYSFSANSASFIVTAFLLTNTTIFRTLGYMQVNLHVLNFILGSILLFNKNKFISALCLAFAFHLKASPLILAFAFLLELNFTWLIWLAFHILWISGITLYTDGISPFFDFYNNAIALASQRGFSTYRDVSFDGFFSTLGQFNGFFSTHWRTLALASKLSLGLIALFIIFQRLSEKTKPGARMFNSMPILLILMTMSSPIVWEHHGIFLALPFLILLPRLNTPTNWTLFIFAYFFQFIIPTFDFFPWSYVRLIAPFVILFLLWKTSDQESTGFQKMNQWFNDLSQSLPLK